MFGLKMNGTELEGRKLRVSKARDKNDLQKTGNTFFIRYY